MLSNEEIGLRIRTRRKELGLTLQAVADEVGVQNSTILRYEKGAINKIKLPVIEAIASALRVNPEWLIGKTNNPTDYDDGDPLAEISLSYMKSCDGDATQTAALERDVEKSPTLEGERKIENPDIRMIARAGRKMTAEQAENLRKYAQYMFPEAFEDEQ